MCQPDCDGCPNCTPGCNGDPDECAKCKSRDDAIARIFADTNAILNAYVAAVAHDLTESIIGPHACDYSDPRT